MLGGARSRPGSTYTCRRLGFVPSQLRPASDVTCPPDDCRLFMSADPRLLVLSRMCSAPGVESLSEYGPIITGVLRTCPLRLGTCKFALRVPGPGDCAIPWLNVKTRHTQAVDIWSFGTVIYQYVYGLTQQISGSALSWCERIVEHLNDWESEEQIDLSSEMIVMDPHWRLAARSCWERALLLAHT